MNNPKLCAELGLAYARWLREPTDKDRGRLIGAVELTFGRGRVIFGDMSGTDQGY